MKRFVPFVIMGTLWLAGCASISQNQNDSKICYHAHCYQVEIADTMHKRMRGLQNRTSLAKDTGMIFIFDDLAVEKFWMKETLIPLDMIWLNEKKEVVFIESEVQPCLADPCPSYGPDQPIKYVIELNAGEAKRLGLTSGEKIRILMN